MTAWKSRIVRYGTSAPDQLLANEQNWRIHPYPQQQVLAGVLDEVGYVQGVIVNLRTSKEWGDRRNIETVVDGHARIEVAISKGQPEIPVVYVDLTPEEEAKVLVTLDPITGMAVTDQAKMDELLREIETDDAALRRMLDDLDEPEFLPEDSAGLQSPAAVPEQEMELKPEEHYDYIVILADNVNDWNRLVRLFELPAVESSRRHRRIGLARAVRARKVLEVLGE